MWMSARVSLLLMLMPCMAFGCPCVLIFWCGVCCVCKES